MLLQLLLQLLGFSIKLGLAFLFFFLFQGFYDTVDGCQPVSLRHHRQLQQGVLQMDGLRKRHQFVEHLRSVRQLFIIVSLLVEQSYGLTIATMGIAEALHFPVQVAKRQQQDTLLDTVPGRFLVAFLISTDGLQCVLHVQVDIADGVIDLVKIFLVVV